MQQTASNLNLEEGKSEELRATLASVAEATAMDGGPRYSERNCRELARIIVCRSYAKPVLELTYLLAIMSAMGMRFEDIFWGMDRPTSAGFRAVLSQNNMPDGITVSSRGLNYHDGNEDFQVSFGRMPFLAALMEFLVMTIGYGEIDDLLATFQKNPLSQPDVGDVANALQRRLYGYLKNHLPPVQRQRREHHFLAFAASEEGNRTGADVVNDDVILKYWQSFAFETEIENKTYRGVYDVARRLIIALEAASERLSGSHAMRIGTDVEAGEFDPSDLDAVTTVLSDETPLERVLKASGDEVKFVNQSEAERLGEIPLDGAAARIPVSVLRSAIYGAVQLRLTTAMRRGADPASSMRPAENETYRQRLDDYAEIMQTTERSLLAALWALHCDKRSAAIELALFLAPDIDWGDMMSPGGFSDENVIQLNKRDATKAFFELEANSRGEETSALLADAKNAWRAVNREGFKNLDDNDALDVMADSVPEVLKLLNAVHRFLDQDVSNVSWAEYEVADAPVFVRMFERMYGAGREEDANAG